MRNAALHMKRYFTTSRHHRIAQAPGCSTFTKCSTSKLIKAVEQYSIFKGLTNVQNFSTNVHGDEASAEYAKSRRASLENEFGHAIGSHGSSALSAYHRFGPFLAFYRAIVILTHVTLLSISHYFVKDIHKRAAKFRRTLIQLGPFYIKLGQALSTRPDILPNAYCQELTKLQDQIPPFPNKIAIECIEKELEAPISMLFAKISEEPVAAASLGQVYKAQLQSGEVVAVKVQRPGMPLALALDAHLIHIIGGHLKHAAKAHGDFLSAINEMVRHMFDEIDYVLEAQNAERFASLYALGAAPELTGRDRKSFPNHSHTKKLCPVKVPKIFWKFTRKSVLTMEWIDGIKLTDKDGVKEANLNIQQLIDQGVYCSLRQLLEEGFFHADPHPGNLVALKNGSLAYLDFGMMGDIPRHYRVGLIRSLVHYVNRDSLGLANDFLSLGFLPEDIDVKYISDALKKSLGDEGRKSNMDFQGVMNQLSDVMYEHMFSLPPDYALVLRALGSLEGTAKILDPDFKVLESAYPFIIGRLLADPDPDMRKVLRELLIRNDGSIRWHRLERLVMAIADESVDVDKNAEDNRSKRPESGMDSMRLNKWSFSFDMRAVAAATVDLLEFIFSGKGERVRIYLVQDIVEAINSVLQERDYGCATPLKTNSARHETVHEAQNYTEASNNDKTPVWFKTIYGDSLSSSFQQHSVTYGSKPQQHNEENNGDERPNKHHGQHESSQQENDQNFLDRIAAGLLAFTTAVKAAPEVWLPLLLHLATRSEVQTFFVDVIDALIRSHRHKIPEALWLKTSEFLHKHYKENS